MDRDRLTELVMHPATAFGTFGAAILGALGFLDPVFGLVTATAGTWFSISALLGSTLLPQAGLGELGQRLVILAALVYLVILADRFSRRAAEYVENRK